MTFLGLHIREEIFSAAKAMPERRLYFAFQDYRRKSAVFVTFTARARRRHLKPVRLYKLKVHHQKYRLAILTIFRHLVTTGKIKTPGPGKS